MLTNTTWSFLFLHNINFFIISSLKTTLQVSTLATLGGTTQFFKFFQHIFLNEIEGLYEALGKPHQYINNELSHQFIV